MEKWLERFAADFLRSPVRVRRIVNEISDKTLLSPAEREHLHSASRKFFAPRSSAESKKDGIGSVLASRMEKLSESKDIIARFIADSNKAVLWRRKER